MTLGRRKRFDTPVGVFTYETVPERLFGLGVRRVELSSTQPYQIASPEKAMVDIIWKRTDLDTPDSMEHYLVYDMRLDLDRKGLFSLERMRRLERAYGKKTVTALTTILAARAGHE